jgi:hypothetical protein
MFIFLSQGQYFINRRFVFTLVGANRCVRLYFGQTHRSAPTFQPFTRRRRYSSVPLLNDILSPYHVVPAGLGIEGSVHIRRFAMLHLSVNKV